MFHILSSYDAHLYFKQLEKKFNRDQTGVNAENKEKDISFNVKINVSLSGVTKRGGKEVRKNIQLRFIESCKFI